MVQIPSFNELFKTIFDLLLLKQVTAIIFLYIVLHLIVTILTLSQELEIYFNTLGK